MRQDPNLSAPLPGTGVLRAEVVHAVRMEMALTLDDVIHRTGMGQGADLEIALEEAAHLMGTELGWSADRTQRELAQISPSPSVPNAPVHGRAQP